MAKLIDFGGSVDSNLVEGLGTNSVTFTMPGNIGIAVESVFASVNNTAGADTGAMLTVTDQSGKVIARQRQSSTLDAGVTGSATWALRLGGDGAPPTTFAWARYRGVKSVPVDPLSASLDWIQVDGVALFDLTNPLLPKVIRNGNYLMSCTVETVGVTAGSFYFALLSGPNYQAGSASSAINTVVNAANNSVNIAMAQPMIVDDTFHLDVWHNQVGAQNCNHVTDVFRIRQA